MTETLKIHEVIPCSRANGPSIRYTIWFQGCTFNCKGCINPATHSTTDGYQISIDDLIKDIIANEKIEGITLTGGEPLLQAETIIIFLKELKLRSNLGIILLTGYSYSELKIKSYFPELSTYTDLIVAGRYIEDQRISYGLRGSANKEYVFLTNRYTIEEIENSPLAEIQFFDNKKIISGSFIDIFLE